MQELTLIPLQRALLRPDHMMGCERELFLLSGIIVALLTLVSFDWIAALAGGLIWVCTLWSLRRMAKTDPIMSRVYIRHVRYAPYYPARSTPFAPSGRHYR